MQLSATKLITLSMTVSASLILVPIDLLQMLVLELPELVECIGKIDITHVPLFLLNPYSNLIS